MNLKRLRAHWDAWGREDPYWAVLTEPGKEGSRWDTEAFFATGVREVESLLVEVRRLVPSLGAETALDFGCGPGRLTQALARHFASVTGVDIAPSMIAAAERHNRWPERCRYVLNDTGDLRRFADASFDFVCSLITLQHIEPRYARAYIAEFVRVAAPGGAICFQLPAARIPPEPGASWARRLKARVAEKAPPARRVYQEIKGAFTRRARMEEHAVPEDQVRAVLAAAGAVVAGVRDDSRSSPAWISRCYFAVKPP
jgi:SAM-dependent methyltransferase